MIDCKSLAAELTKNMREIYFIFHDNDSVRAQIQMAWVEDDLLDKYKKHVDH